MSSAEADALPPHLHAMVESDNPLVAAIFDARVLRCRECGELDTLPHVADYEREWLEEARAWRRAGWTDGEGLLPPS